MHHLLDGEPKIIDDPLAARLIDPRILDEIRGVPPWIESTRVLRAQVLARTRYAEDRLAEAVTRGVDQLVILGAGLDTFAYRQPAWAAALRVLEVDRESALADKRERLARAGLAIPGNVAQVALDFERLAEAAAESLSDQLGQHGFDARRAAFVSGLGVLGYLSIDARSALLRAVAALAPGSEAVFSFRPPAGDQPEVSGKHARLLAELIASTGETIARRVEGSDLIDTLEALGFSASLADADTIAGYFTGRSDGLTAPSSIRVIHAVVR